MAVIAVVAFHEQLSAFSGGFLGVDVFFVLSGYLITDPLVARWIQHGRLDLGGFWARRARRLLPALAVLLVAVTAATAVIQPAQLAALRAALLAAVTYSSNWWQALAHHSYFAQFGPPPPLQHLWSRVPAPAPGGLDLAARDGALGRSRRRVVAVGGGTHYP